MTFLEEWLRQAVRTLERARQELEGVLTQELVDSDDEDECDDQDQDEDRDEEGSTES